VYTIRGTGKFLARVGRPVPDPSPSTTILGDWYANLLFWRTQVALFVNAPTFLPVFVPLAPAAGVLDRFPAAMAAVLRDLAIDPRFIDTEVVEMDAPVLATTASRQVLGVMNEHARMADHAVTTGRAHAADVLGLSTWLATTIVGPLTHDDRYTPLGAVLRLVDPKPP
jgi:hypothetical protein